jgi:hypothetical protein
MTVHASGERVRCHRRRLIAAFQPVSNSRQQSFRQVLFRASARLYDDQSLKRFDDLD